MHILLTNDDGIFAPGLAAIYKRLTGLGKITVAAPSDV
ncbi:MAG: 5'/3'-nucleotidase SurE, partial [Planctomycetota bacterium]